MSIETFQTEIQKNKGMEKPNIQDMWDNFKRCDIVMIRMPECEERM